MSTSLEEQYGMPLYRLLKDIPLAKKGTVFYYDKGDQVHGSIAEGCLKLAWTENGCCQANVCADTIIFHASALGRTDWFKAIPNLKEKYMRVGIVDGEILYKKDVRKD